MNEIPKLSAVQKEKLGNYVYVYYDVENREPFYVGRGQDGRVICHMRGSHNDDVGERIQGRDDWGVDILIHGIDKETAKKVEAAAIDLIGIDRLYNKTRGEGAAKYGRVKLSTLLSSMTEEDLAYVPDNLIVVSINETYKKYGDNEQALHESTRGVWADISDQKAEEAQYILGIVEGRVVYVMEKRGTLPGGSQSCFVRERIKNTDRKEFVGFTADEEIQERYLGKKINLSVQRPAYLGPFAKRVRFSDGEWLPV